MSDKREAFLRKDRVVRAITEDKYIKIAAVKTTDVVKEARRRHGLSLTATVVLGKALTGVMLLAVDLKGEERIALNVEGNGRLGKVVAEANHRGEIRGFVSHPSAEIDIAAGERLSDAVGDGVLSVTKVLFENARPITGTVKMVHKNISGDLADYLLYSEQVRSAILLDVGITPEGEVEEAGGIIVQALPGAPDELVENVAKNLDQMRNISQLLSEGLYLDGLIEKAVAPLKVKELARYPVQFFCRCSKERFVNALKLLPLEDLKSLADSDQTLTCQYCAESYGVSREEIQELLKSREKRE